MPLIGTAIGKANYAPPEQVMKGIVYPHTDLYTLAATSVVLLSGKTPQELRNSVDSQWNWQSFVSINPKLESILSKMFEPKPSDRFGSAMEVKQILQNYLKIDNYQAVKTDYQLPPSPQTKFNQKSQFKYFNLKYLNLIIPIILIFLLGGLIYPRIVNFRTSSRVSIGNSNNSPKSNGKLTQKFSEGEKMLISQLATHEKEMATAAFAQGNYQKSASLLSASLKIQTNDPEGLIYFNNALIG